MSNLPLITAALADAAVRFDPIVDAQSALPLAWQAQMTNARGEDLDTLLGQLPELAAAQVDAARAERMVHAAVAAGIGETGAMLAVPVSSRHAGTESVVARIFRAAITARFPAERLVVLVDAGESADADGAHRLIAACDSHGIDIAFRRFAMGPGGIRLLARYTPALVLLDPALVANLSASAARASILDGVVRLARRTGLTLAAPGVASATDLAALQRAGVRYMQGSWIAAPISSAARSMPVPEFSVAEPRRLNAAVARRELDATHRRLQHHQRAAATRPLPAEPLVAIQQA